MSASAFRSGIGVLAAAVLTGLVPAQGCPANGSGTSLGKPMAAAQYAFEASRPWGLRLYGVSFFTATASTQKAMLTAYVMTRDAAGLPDRTIAASNSRWVRGQTASWIDVGFSRPPSIAANEKFFLVLVGRGLVFPETTGGAPVRTLRFDDKWVAAGTPRVAYRTGCAVTGRSSPIGTGCKDSVGNTPVHAGSGLPRSGRGWQVTVGGARPNLAGVVFFGASRTRWGSYSLPLGLGFLGMPPACSLFVSADEPIPIRLDASGKASLVVVLNVPITTRFYTQVALLDPALSATVPVLTTNGLETVVGG